MSTPTFDMSTPTPTTPRSFEAGLLKQRFDVFFKARETSKQELYGKVALRGWVLFLVGITAGLSGAAVWYTTPSPEGLQFQVGAGMVAFFSFVFAFGVAMISVVPTSEFDLDKFVDSSPRKTLIRAAFTVLLCFAGVIALFVLPCVTGVPLIACGLWVGLPDSLLQRCNLKAAITTKLSYFSAFLFFPIGAVYIILPYLGWVIVLPNFFMQPTALPSLSAVVGALYLLAGCYVLYVLRTRENAHRVDELGVQSTRTLFNKKGWRTATLYTCIYVWMLVAGFNCFLFNGVAIFIPRVIQYQANLAPNFAFVLCFLAPIVFTLCIGSRRTFLFLARRFELDHNRLKEDGALMAELASSSKILDLTSNNYWLKRRVELTVEPSEWLGALNPPELGVKRRFFLRCSIQQHIETSYGSVELQLACRMDDDVDAGWAAVYSDCGVNFKRFFGDNSSAAEAEQAAGGGGAAAVPNPSAKLDFSAWCAANFHKEDIVSADMELRTVIVKAKMVAGKSSSKDLMIWATSNFRVFDWENFNDGLLLKSPRQLSSDEEKKQLYGLSRPVTVHSERTKADFFVSHSWEDDATTKCKALRKFMAQNKGATLWLDKVCIDQMNPGDALSVLPINVGMCKRLLILMSPSCVTWPLRDFSFYQLNIPHPPPTLRSYLKRLWCVWELFSLFTFCNDELAVERIAICAVQDDFDVNEAFQKFDLNEAHCFDPNEECKFRHISRSFPVCVCLLLCCVALTSPHPVRSQAAPNYSRHRRLSSS